MKIVAHNKRLRRVIRSRIRPVWVRNEKMIIGTAQGLHWSPDEHDLMIARFIKALYDDCFKRPLPLHVPVEASRQQPFTAKVLDMWRSWPGENIEGFIVSQLKAHIALDDAVHGERRRANERAQKAGKVIALGFLSPIGPEPFRRLRERSGRALAAFSAGMKREKRPKLRLKSEKRPRRSQS